MSHENFMDFLHRPKFDENGKVLHYYIFMKYKKFVHNHYSLGGITWFCVIFLETMNIFTNL